MKHEESFKLMEIMIRMGFGPKLIMHTLAHCSYGKSIGVSYVDAFYELNVEK